MRRTASSVRNFFVNYETGFYSHQNFAARGARKLTGWRLDGAGQDGGVTHPHHAALEAGENLSLKVVCGAGVVGEKDRAGATLGADVTESVEVLGEEDQSHDVFGGGAGDRLTEVFDGGAEAVDDGLTLGGDAFALQSLGFGFGLGLFDFEDFIGFASCLCCDLGALGGIDVIHRVFDFGVGDDVGDQSVQDVIAEAGHGGVEFCLDGDRDAGLLLECFIERELGDVAEDGVEDEGLDLFLRGAELVEGVVDLVVQDLVLDRDGDLNEDVVMGLGFNCELGLLDLEVDEVDALGVGDQDVEARADDAVEFAEALDDSGGVGADGVEGLENGDQNDDGEEDQEDDQGSIHWIHGLCVPCKREYMRNLKSTMTFCDFADGRRLDL
jgi:hypothetical protein